MTGLYSRDRMYPLPDAFPEDTTCWKIDIPNNDQYASLLLGAISELTYWFNYLRDEDKTGQVVAKYFQQAVLTLRSCGEGMIIDVRQNPLYPCKLDKEVEVSGGGGGTEWIEFANLRLCPPRLQVKDGGIQYTTDDGVTWVDYPNDGSLGGQPGEQPGGDEPISAGGCKSVTCLVQGNSQFIVPFRVMPGDRLTITDPQGAWYYESIAINWWCGTGNSFLLGACSPNTPLIDTGIDGVHVLTRLIARYGSAFLDPVGGEVTIPAGSEYPLVFQMNDSDLSNNGGSMSFVATICSGLWCYAFYFISTDGGFTPLNEIPTQNEGTWVDGVGWVGDTGSAGTVLSIQKTFANVDDVDQVEIYWEAPPPDGGFRGVQINGGSYQWNGQSPLVLPMSGALTSLVIKIHSMAQGQNIRCGTVVIRGKGDNPLGTTNC